jgi:Flp pilus assembly protein protease CpaA
MISGVLLVYLALAVGFDLRARRIPNVISGPALLLGLILNAAQSGTASSRASAVPHWASEFSCCPLQRAG